MFLNGKTGKLSMLILFMTVLILGATNCEGAVDDKVLSRWSQTKGFEGDLGGRMDLKVTYYAAEYIEALVRQEAEKNLWTADETEKFKYELLKSLQLDEYIPIHIDIDNKGTPMHMAPFDSFLTLYAGKKKLSPVDYDKRFNFRLLGQRDGMVFFPRYDEKGKSNLEGVKTIRFSMNSAISDMTMKLSAVDFFWDVHKDNPEALYAGKAADRLELDRLIKRLEKLNSEKSELEKQQNELETELSSINKRVEELQKK